MKKVLSYILLFVFIFIINGYSVWLKHLQHQIKHEAELKIKKGIKEKDIDVLTFSLSEYYNIKWTKKYKEFTLNGKMYDVVKIKTKGSKKYIYCINDIKEKQLIARLTRHNRRRNKILNILKKITANKYLSSLVSHNQLNNETTVCFGIYNRRFNSIDIDVYSPPPENILS